MGDLPELNTFMAGCPDVKADFDVVTSWFKYWKAQGEMKVYSTAYKDIVGNMAEFKTDYSTLRGDYDSKDWNAVGKDASVIAKLALPVATSGLREDPVDCGDFTLTNQDIADYLAGFVHGFSGNDHKAYFETCIHINESFEHDVCSVVMNLRTKENQKVLEAVQ